MSPDLFAGRLEMLAAHRATVLPLSEAVDRLRQGTLPPRAVALTFDDGFFDFQQQAWPILRRFGFPATVYLTTYYSQRNLPVFGIASSYLLWKSGRPAVSLREITGEDISLPCATPADRNACRAHLETFAAARGWNGVEKDALLQRLAAEAGVAEADREIRRHRMLHLLTPAESAALAAQGADFQLHTHRHRTPLDPALFRREIDDNRRSLQASGAAADPVHFCYPSGVHESAFLPWLREAGVQTATTCDTGLANPTTEPLLLPRLVDFSQLQPVEFEAWLAGAPALLPRKSRHGFRIG